MEKPQPQKAIDIREMTRQKIGLVNKINPPRPQPSKEDRPRRVGGSKARKILKGQQ